MNNEANNQQIPEAGVEAEEASIDHSQLPLEEQIVALRGDLERALMDASQNLDQAQRAQAELMNYRRRADEERVSLGKYSNGRLITKLLPVVEELDLAVTHGDAEGASSSWLEGVRLIQRKLLNLLESEGVAAIEAVGTPFNPLEHEALGTEESAEFPPGYVIEAIRPGYRLHDRVIQPAQVIVAIDAQATDQTIKTTETAETEETDNA